MPSRTRQGKILTTKCSKMSTLRLEVSSKSTRTFDTSVIKNKQRPKLFQLITALYSKELTLALEHLLLLLIIIFIVNEI